MKAKEQALRKTVQVVVFRLQSEEFGVEINDENASDIYDENTQDIYYD